MEKSLFFLAQFDTSAFYMCIDEEEMNADIFPRFPFSFLHIQHLACYKSNHGPGPYVA